MDPQPGLPVYRARILDAVDWSTEGWCIIVLRFPELALPLVVDDLDHGEVTFPRPHNHGSPFGAARGVPFRNCRQG